MKRFQDFIMTSIMAGFLVLAPFYLAVLLLLKAAASLVGLLKPVARLLPDWMPAEGLLALILVLLACLLVGAALRTRTGRVARERLEHSLFERIPGYAVFKSLTLRLTGQGQEGSWRPAFAEIEEALVPAFIIEEFEDGRYTVFVPSVPTPFAGAVYVLAHERVRGQSRHRSRLAFCRSPWQHSVSSSHGGRTRRRSASRRRCLPVTSFSRRP
jgi:uncharacterized membrane protein